MHDPVDEVIQAYLDYLEGAREPPRLDHLGEDDRRLVDLLIESLDAGRGIDPHASRPSIESLLAGTELEASLQAAQAASVTADALTALRDELACLDDRAHVEIDVTRGDEGAVVYSYLDLRSVFLLVAGPVPALTEEVTARARSVFRADPETSWVALVAADSDDLVTQMLSADDLGPTVVVPSGTVESTRLPARPLLLAARWMLQQSSPEWDAFDFAQTLTDPVDFAAVADEIAQAVLEREAARSYRGDKARAYRSLVDQRAVFVDLVTQVAGAGSAPVDLDAATIRIAEAAA